MKWFYRLNRALSVYGMLQAWFAEASLDGKLTAEEIGEGVQMLVDALGYGDRIEVEPLNLEGP